MVHVPKDHVKQELLDLLHKDRTEVPNFEVVQVRVDMGKGSKISERTRAYEIQCLQKDASSLAKLLQSGSFKTTPIYVPYRIKRSDPNTFKRAIKRQIRTLAEQWVIKIQGFTADMMEYARPKLQAPHNEGIVPTKNTTKGEWKILVHKTHYAKAIAWLQENWNDIVEAIPAEAYDNEMMAEPKITSRNSAATDVSSEDGSVDTYGTILSNLYYGFATDEEDDTKSENSGSSEMPSNTTASRPVSYAQVIGGNTSSVSQVSGCTETRNDEMAKLQEKHSTLEQKLNTVTEEFNTVTAELVELKSLLQQLLSKGH